METDRKMKDSIFGLISIISAVSTLFVFYATYFLDLELKLVFIISLSVATIGILLGVTGLIVSSITKATHKRLSIWGIGFNVFFIFTIIVLLSAVMGGR